MENSMKRTDNSISRQINTGNLEDNLALFKDIATPETLQHSLNVMQVMSELSEIYSLDATKAKITGLLHDTAKDLDSQELLTLAERAKIVFDYPCERLPIYLHGPVGAYLVQKELQIADEILDAISTHTHYGQTSKPHADLSWCLRFADLLEPTRRWKGVKKLRSVVYGGHMEKAALLLTGWLIEYFQEVKVPVHPNIVRVHHQLAAAVHADEDFFDR